MALLNISLVKKNIPIKLGIVLAPSGKVSSKYPDFDIEFQKLKQETELEFATKPLSDDSTVSAVRKLYRSAGWEPTKYRPSSEALLRRILKGLDWYRINNLVDAANLVSAWHKLPLGLYDLDLIEQPVEMDIGCEDESYEGISKPQISATGKLILRDRKGVFGNPTADSKRTSIRPKTINAVVIFFCPENVSDDHLKNAMRHIEKYYNPFCDGAIQMEIKKFV